MTTAADYLNSVLDSLKTARECIVALSTIPTKGTDSRGYLGACENPGDAAELAKAYSAIEDAEFETKEAIALLEGA